MKASQHVESTRKLMKKSNKNIWGKKITKRGKEVTKVKKFFFSTVAGGADDILFIPYYSTFCGSCRG